MRIFFIIIIFLLLGKIEIVVAQETNHFPKQFLIQLKPNQSIQNLQERLYRDFTTAQWLEPQRLIPNMNYFLLEYQENGDDAAILEFLKNAPIVQTAQYNHKITLRSPNSTVPNDAFYSNQWQYKNIGGAIGGVAGVDLDAELAWDITTGGMTALNDTIVIAILDEGISPNHPDFGDNLWRNRAEIPGNHIDDDNNGYEDDYLGWNSISNTDYITGGAHGTSVAGIVGAQGNNNIGVAGVNWNIKMMIINKGTTASEAVVLASYGYALTQRKIYNRTNGQAGAYVVATNASWGINGGQPANAPLWCAFYDTLGAAGILNVAATANQNVNVDTYGDLPTACPSDYLVAVTNINKLGNKASDAAYGNTAIDLGSFGTGVYTTTVSPGGYSYGTFGGTSGASPHVAGAVGLLYSGACSNFIAYSRVYPDSAALKMKAYLLAGVVPIPDLVGKSVSEGYLNLFNSLNICINDCPSQGCFAPYQISVTNVLDTQAQIQFNWTPSVQQVRYAYREQGGIWSNTNTLLINQKSFILNNLIGCTDYELLLISVCNGNNGDSIIFNFKTDGCCEAPQGLAFDNINSDSIHLVWQPLLASNYYILQYKESSASIWQNISNITNTNIWINNLMPCTYYDIKIQAVCTNGDTTALSNMLHIPTLGCQNCNTLPYCLAQGNNSSDDYIDSFWVDNFVVGSGNNGGYAFFGSSGILLNKGDYHNVWIRQGKTYVEYVKIWLDINQDGDFDDAEEEIFFNAMPVTPPIYKSSFIVPATAYLGITRMRVAMRYNNPPNNCGSIDYGEVEDYCVQIIPGTSTTQLTADVFDMLVFPNPYKETFQVQIELKKDTDLDFSIFSTTGQLVFSQNTGLQSSGKHSFILQPDLPSGAYFLKVQTKEGQVVQLIVNN